MSCPCGCSFCYNCTSPWEPLHLDHFSCPSKAASSKRAEFEVTAYFVDKYQGHSTAMNTARNTADPEASACEALLTAALGICKKESSFIRNCYETLVGASSVLMWSYAWANFMAS
jgi:hypothetical protein